MAQLILLQEAMLEKLDRIITVLEIRESPVREIPRSAPPPLRRPSYPDCVDLPVGGAETSFKLIEEAPILGKVSVESPEVVDIVAVTLDDSMEPIIGNGALLYIKDIQSNVRLNDNDIVLCFLVESRKWVIRRAFFQKKRGKLWICLKPENPEYPGIWYEYSPGFILCQGKVVEWENNPHVVNSILAGMEKL